MISWSAAHMKQRHQKSSAGALKEATTGRGEVKTVIAGISGPPGAAGVGEKDAGEWRCICCSIRLPVMQLISNKDETECDEDH